MPTIHGFFLGFDTSHFQQQLGQEYFSWDDKLVPKMGLALWRGHWNLLTGGGGGLILGHHIAIFMYVHTMVRAR